MIPYTLVRSSRKTVSIHIKPTGEVEVRCPKRCSKREAEAFLVSKDGVARVLPVSVPPVSSVERIVDLVPNVLDRVENFIDKKSKKTEEGIL